MNYRAGCATARLTKRTGNSVRVSREIAHPALGATEIIHAQPTGYATKLAYNTDLQSLPGQEVLISVLTGRPGFRLPLHMHPDGHEFVYVLEGEQTFEIEGVGTKVIRQV